MPYVVRLNVHLGDAGVGLTDRHDIHGHGETREEFKCHHAFLQRISLSGSIGVSGNRRGALREFSPKKKPRGEGVFLSAVKAVTKQRIRSYLHFLLGVDEVDWLTDDFVHGNHDDAAVCTEGGRGTRW